MTAHALYGLSNLKSSGAAERDVMSGRYGNLFRRRPALVRENARGRAWIIGHPDDDIWTARYVSNPTKLDRIEQEDFSGLSLWAQAQRTVSEWFNLGDDWDGEEGVPPRRGALVALLSLIRRASDEKILAARPYIAGDGEVGLRWEVGDYIATASFLHDARFIAYCPRPDGEPVRVIGDYGAAAKLRDFFEAVRSLT